MCLTGTRRGQQGTQDVGGDTYRLSRRVSSRLGGSGSGGRSHSRLRCELNLRIHKSPLLVVCRIVPWYGPNIHPPSSAIDHTATSHSHFQRGIACTASRADATGACAISSLPHLLYVRRALIAGCAHSHVPPTSDSRCATSAWVGFWPNDLNSSPSDSRGTWPVPFLSNKA